MERWSVAGAGRARVPARCEPDAGPGGAILCAVRNVLNRKHRIARTRSLPVRAQSFTI